MKAEIAGAQVARKNNGWVPLISPKLPDAVSGKKIYEPISPQAMTKVTTKKATIAWVGIVRRSLEPGSCVHRNSPADSTFMLHVFLKKQLSSDLNQRARSSRYLVAGKRIGEFFANAERRAEDLPSVQRQRATQALRRACGLIVCIEGMLQSCFRVAAATPHRLLRFPYYNGNITRRRARPPAWTNAAGSFRDRGLCRERRRL